jgi:hypothetical protein
MLRVAEEKRKNEWNLIKTFHKSWRVKKTWNWKKELRDCWEVIERGDWITEKVYGG